MFPLFDEGLVTASPFGLQMCQNRLAVPTWSYAMERLPPSQIVEIGSGTGGFTTALGVHAYHLGAKIVSYERDVVNASELSRFLGITFRDQVDAWTCVDEITELIQRPGRSYVLCDGGDKPREFATFAAFLKPGDVIAAHDYVANEALPWGLRPWPWSEIRQTDAAPAVERHGLSPWLQEAFDMAGWLVFKKV